MHKNKEKTKRKFKLRIALQQPEAIQWAAKTFARHDAMIPTGT